MPFLENLGMQAAGQSSNNIIGGVMGAIFGRAENRRQYHQQKRLQALQIQGQKELTDYNMLKQLEMFDKTGYEAQVKQLQKAGLNAGLLYGMGGGAGGSTNVSTGNVSGGVAQKGDSSGFMSAGMGMNLALMDAQREVLKSQARLNEVEANKKAGVDTQNVEADTGLKLNQAKESGEKTKVLEAEKRIKEQEARLKEDNYYELQAELIYNSRIAAENLDAMVRNNHISRATMEEQKEQIRQNVQKTIADKLVSLAQVQNINLDSQMITKNLDAFYTRLGMEMQKLGYEGRNVSATETRNAIEEAKKNIDREFKEGLIKIGEWDLFINGAGQINKYLPISPIKN